MSRFMAQDLQTGTLGPALHLEHLPLLELYESRVREVKGNRYAWYPIRGEPFLRKPCVRPKPESATLQLRAQHIEPSFDARTANLDTQIAEAEFEELLVAPPQPSGLSTLWRRRQVQSLRTSGRGSGRAVGARHNRRRVAQTGLLDGICYGMRWCDCGFYGPHPRRDFKTLQEPLIPVGTSSWRVPRREIQLDVFF